ncbi:MAG: prolyl oligopeptidase family serine peptidase [Chitinispirillaceae bacterium]|nr:prolyl oligopeptidase family serine peptidase [Chitinispirillaceae bacterium]
MLKYGGIFILFQLATVFSQDTEFTAHRFDNGADFILPYMFHPPQNISSDKRYPLLIFFHGAGEWGDDNYRQLANFPYHFINSINSAAYPCYALAPQCTEADAWTSFPRYPEVYNPPTPTRSMAQVLALLDTLCESDTLFVDTNRIYVTGQSLGGEAVFDIVTRAPHRFAAANPICGIADTAKAELMKETPFWIFHGTEDDITDVNYSRIIVEALTGLGTPPRYTEYEGAGHNVWTTAYDEPELLPWLFDQERSTPVHTGKKAAHSYRKTPTLKAIKTNRKITLSWTGILPYEIGVFSLSGKCLYKAAVTTSDRIGWTIDLNNIASGNGCYLVRLRCGNASVITPVF